MDQSAIISQNYLCSGKPVQVARSGVQALDISTGTLYKQTTIPSGVNYVVKARNYYQPSQQEIPPVTPITFSGSFDIDFGSGESTVYVVVENANVTSSSQIVFRPSSRQEDFSIEDIAITAISLVSGVSFQVLAYAPNNTTGTYSITYTIIN